MCRPKACRQALLRWAKLRPWWIKWDGQTDCAISACAVLDFVGRVFAWSCTVNEHDERAPDVQRLRVDMCACHRHARPATGLGTPSALLDLEQQLRRRPRQSRSASIAAISPSTSSGGAHGLSSRSSPAPVGRDNHLRNVRGRVKSSPEFPRFDHDRQGSIHRHVGEGPSSPHGARNLGGAGVVRIPGCKSCSASSCRARLRTITWPPTWRR